MPSLKHALFAILCIFVLNFSAYALPLSVRQVNGSQTLETVTTEMTPDGPVTVTCTIVLTPVTDGNGQAAIQEVRTCKFVLNPRPSQPTASTAPVETSSPNSPATTSSTTSTDVSNTSNAVPTTTASASPSGGSGTVSTQPVSSVTVSSSSVSASSSPSKGTVSAEPVSTVTPITSTSVSSPTSTSSSPGTTTSSTSAQSISDAATTTAAASSTTSGTTAAAAADSSNATVNLPGKKLSVLPIGLGVFAGISVIALIVVGLVTYERRKYRKAFRERKLAESGAAMGYGGMGQ